MERFPSMPDYILHRIGRFILLFTGILIVGFGAIHMAPGSPTDTLAPMTPGITAEDRQKLVRLYHLDRPLHLQFVFWAESALRQDFGNSLIDGQKVSDKIGKAAPITLGLNLVSLLLGLLIAIPMGTWMALHPGKPLKIIAGIAILALISFPGFWLALVLMSRFGVELRWLPVSGLHSLFYEHWPWHRQALDFLWHLVLPLAVWTLPTAAVLSRYVEEAMRVTLKQNYVRSARARGLSERSVLFNHALRNALLPIVTLLGLSVPGLLGGSVVLETVFSIPGMGRLFYQSVLARDYPVIMAVFVLGAFLTLLGNALADLTYTRVDPRIRHEEP